MSGVKEDVITILLNLKKLRFEIIGGEAQRITISAKGPKKISGSDLEIPGQVRLLNPNSYICELTDKNADFRAEFTVERGLGYVPREALKKERVEIGEISVDAIFSPIRRVNYEVENMRIGDRTDFNRLRISIETDGTLTPRVALEQSIEFMITPAQVDRRLQGGGDRHRRRACRGSGGERDGELDRGHEDPCRGSRALQPHHRGAREGEHPHRGRPGPQARGRPDGDRGAWARSRSRR